jgi:hypothetical protein
MLTLISKCSFLKVSGIDDLSEVPNTSDPEHSHVKAILLIYSMESFLFQRLNEACRNKDAFSIKTLGPYATALTMVINEVQYKRKDSLSGEFICYRGFALHPSIIEMWKHQKTLKLEGYNSTSMDESMARKFAA